MDEEKRKLEELDNEYTIKFKKRQWIVIYNLLVTNEGRPRLYTLGDAKLVNEICEHIELTADLRPKEAKNGVMIN